MVVQLLEQRHDADFERFADVDATVHVEGAVRTGLSDVVATVVLLEDLDTSERMGQPADKQLVRFMAREPMPALSRVIVYAELRHGARTTVANLNERLVLATERRGIDES